MSSRARGRFAGALLLTVLALAASACGGNACGDVDASGASSAPKVTKLELATQLEGDPWTTIFAASFSDSDADLALGEARFHLNESSSPSTVQPLRDVFRQSALDESATKGTLALALRFNPDIDDGSEVRVGLQLEDGAGHSSNCYGLTLEFDVRRALRSLDNGLRLAWHGLGTRGAS